MKLPVRNAVHRILCVSGSSGSLSSRLRNRWTVLLICSALFVFSQFYRVSNTIIGPGLQRDLNLSSEALGTISAAFYYAFALVQIPLGIILDRFGSRLTMTVLSSMGAMGAWLFASADAMAFAVMGRVLLGVGMSANLIGSMKLLDKWFSPTDFAMASGLVMSLGTVGTLSASTPLAVLVNLVGWRGAFWLTGGLTAMLTLFFFLLVRDLPATSIDYHEISGRSGHTIWRKLYQLASSPNFWLISACYFLQYGALSAVHGLWIGPYLIYILRLSPIETGNLLLLLNVGLIVGYPLSGFLCRRFFSPKWTIIAGLATMSITELAFCRSWSGNQQVLLGTSLFLFGLSGATGVLMFAHVKESAHGDMTGVAFAGLNFFAMFGGAVFIQSTGWFLDNWTARGGLADTGYHIGFLAGAAAVATAFLLYLWTENSGSDY